MVFAELARGNGLRMGDPILPDVRVRVAALLADPWDMGISGDIVEAVERLVDRMARTLLQVEFEGVDGWDADRACPACGGWACTGHRHENGCDLNASLVALGLDTREKRDAAREWYERNRT